MSMVRYLPAELLPLILRELRDSDSSIVTAALRAAALVARAWLAPAQALLFEQLHVHLDHLIERFPLQLPRLIYIASRPHLSSKVHSLQIGPLDMFTFDSDDPDYMAYYVPIPEMLSWLPVLLPHIDRLVFSWTGNPDFYSRLFLQTAAAWPALRTITGYVPDNVDLHAFQTQNIHLPPIQTLDLDSSICENLVTTLNKFQGTSAAHSLHHLCLSTMFYRAEEDAITFQTFIQVLAGFSNLSILCLQITAWDQEEFEAGIASMDFPLGPLPCLVSLTLSIPGMSGASVSFLRSLFAYSKLPALQDLQIELDCRWLLAKAEMMNLVKTGDTQRSVAGDEEFMRFIFDPFCEHDIGGSSHVLERPNDGPILPKDLWCRMQEISIRFTSDCPVIVRHASSFLELFGGLTSNPALWIDLAEVELDVD